MKYLALLLTLFVILACGGGGSGLGTTGGGGGGTEIPVAKRTAAINKVETKVENLYGSVLTSEQRNVQIAAYMRTLPEFADAQPTIDETVWGRFTDGRFLVVVTNRLPDRFSDRPAGAPPYIRKESMAPDKVTTSTKARLFHSFGTGFNQQQHPIQKMGEWLTKAGFTLSPTQEGDARLATLRGVSGDGFFYFNTHGGSFEFSSTEKVYCVGSSTLRNDGNEALPEIKSDLDSKKVVYMTAANGEFTTVLGKDIPRFDTRYAITSKFVDAYWSFGANAVVFMNSCWSGYDKVANGAQGFYFACLKKGAGAYLGWTDKVATPTSENAPQFFVDRLTAANVYDKENPDQRPFFITEIVKDMHDQGVVPGPGRADLVVRLKAAGSNVGLRPTIHYLAMSEVQDELNILGKFGDQEGAVSIDGVGAAVTDWTNEVVTVTIPKSGQGSSGDVIVKVHGKESNKRRLSKWTSNFSLEEKGAGTLKMTITAKLIFRADFAKRRTKPGETIKLTDPIPFWASPESTCSFTASGEHRDGNNKLLEKWSGSGVQTLSLVPFQTPQAKYVMNGAYDPTTGEVALGIICGGPKVITGDNPITVMAGGAPYIKMLNPITWTLPPDSQPGDFKWSFSAFNVTHPPLQETQY